MALLTKGGVLAAVGGALKRFVAGCADACCAKWYCHLPSYTCDQDETNHISEHSSQAACLKACGDGVEHYCHIDGECDTDPTDSVAKYPSKSDCDDACGKWWCCYQSLDFTKGSACREGPCDQPELIRAGPFESKQECEPDCELQYYCVLDGGVDGSQSDHYLCVVDPTGYTVLAGPQTEDECDATCSSRRPTIWCVDNKRCVLSYSGPPVECSFGVFCEEHPNFIDCGLNCLDEKWYCIPADNKCMQLAMPPTPGAQPYGSQNACEKECQSYYCCWVSQGDPTKGSYCQLGECDPGFEKSGPHDDEVICEADCNSIYCWSYYDQATGETARACQEDEPAGCDPGFECSKVSGPYGSVFDCARVCFPPEYKWFCKDDYCVKCCATGTCTPTDRSCPDGVTLYDKEVECSAVCAPPPGVVWVCLIAGGCQECYNDEAPGVPPNTTNRPNCSSLPPRYSDAYATEAQCDSSCLKDVTCWECLSGGVCGPVVYNTPGGQCPPFSYPTQLLCQLTCNNPLP